MGMAKKEWITKTNIMVVNVEWERNKLKLKKVYLVVIYIIMA
jgi:hypothetical protein